MITVFGSELNNKRSKRSAVLPYVIKPSELENGPYTIYFLMGEYQPIADNSSVINNEREFTDLGGGVKKDETDIQAAYRECSEEAKVIFDNIITIDHLSTCISVTKSAKSPIKKPTDIRKSRVLLFW